MSFKDNYNIAIVGLGNVGSEVYRHLVKGAAGQAVQNMNIRLGLKESLGLK